MIRKLHFSKHGLVENPVGQIVRWSVNGRQYVCDVTGVRRDEYRGFTFLQTRHFNGETGPEVAASVVEILLPDLADYAAA